MKRIKSEIITEFEVVLDIRVLDLVPVINLYEEQPLLSPFLPDHSYFR